MITKKRTEIIFMTLTVLFVLVGSALAEGEWAANGNNIHNTNSGNVGIGTMNPKASLHIWNTNEYNTSQSPVGQDSIILRGAVAGANGKYFGGITWFDGGDRRRAGIASVMEHDDSDHVGLAFLTQGTDGPGPMYESMRITRRGNVGIGTSIPSEKLDVAGGIRTDSISIINGTSSHLGINSTPHSDANEAIRMHYWGYIGGTPGDYPYWAMNVYSKTDGKWNSFHSSLRGSIIGNFGNAITFLSTPPNTNPTSPVEHMRIDTITGNVGIGTTNPKASLHIWNTNEYDTSQSPVGQDSIILRGAVTGANGKYFGGITWFDGGDRRRAGIASVMENDDSDHVGLAFLTQGTDGPGPMYESMRITRRGNVGIGMTNPQSKLAVNGTITAKEIKVESGWSDFVFDEDYDLASLGEIESYIRKNKHLPDIPSAKEVEQQGIAVSEMFAKQMQKIEELTLYLIKLEKENMALKVKNAEVEKRLAKLEAGWVN